MDYFLGLDLSSQQLKASIIDVNLECVLEEAVHFQNDLPEFKTTHGVHKQHVEGLVEQGITVTSGGEQITSPVDMWLKALDKVLQKIPTDICKRIKVISGAGQQHSSVWWSQLAPHMLQELDAQKDLSQLVPSAFTMLDCPTWQDATTHIECTLLEKAVGGANQLAQITGSRAHDRFTGAQIKRYKTIVPEVYEKTERISLASSFLASLFLGKFAPMDCADVCGMNLYDLQAKQWSQELLKCVSRSNRVDLGLNANDADSNELSSAEELRRKLGDVELDSSRSLGFIHPFFSKRYGFDASCVITPFTGDNPATLLATTVSVGDIIHSLGTSDTIMLSTLAYEPTIDSHVFIHPTTYKLGDTERYMAMVCYKNGSLAREWVRNKYAQGNWDTFMRLLSSSPSTSDSLKVGFYFTQQEIIPKVSAGVYRYVDDGVKIDKDVDFEDAARSNVLGILESQFMSARVQATMLMGQKNPLRVIAVGGASNNLSIIKVLANVFNAPVYKLGETNTNSCSIGAARKALWAFERSKRDVSFEDFIKERLGSAELLSLVAEPDPILANHYTDVLLPMWIKSREALIENYGLH